MIITILNADTILIKIIEILNNFVGEVKNA